MTNMDHPNIGEDDEDPTHVESLNFTVNKLMYKAVKRTRSNVNHLTDEEKCRRKRFLGRERARRYRERKRSIDSSISHHNDKYLNISSKAKSVECFKRLRNKNNSTGVLFPMPKPFARKALQADRLLVDKDAVVDASACISEAINIEMDEILKEPEWEDNILSRNLMPVDISTEELASREMHEGADMESQDANKEHCPETWNMAAGTALPCVLSTSDIKVDEHHIKNSADSCQMEPQGKSCDLMKNTFKQQNVKDFINFFPVDNCGTIDSKSFVTGSCSMQKKIEYVPSMEKSSSSNLTFHEVEPPLELPTGCSDTIMDVSESPANASKEDNRTSLCMPVSEPLEHHKQTCSSAPISQEMLSSAHPIRAKNVLVSDVLDTASASFQIQQTLQDVQVSGLLQENKLINTAAVNAVVNPLVIGGKQNVSDCKEISSLQGIVGVQNVQGVGTVPGTIGIQGACVNGTSIWQGVQGLTDPRLVSLAGLPNMGVLQDIASLQGFLGSSYRISDVQGISGLQNVGLLHGTSNPAGIGTCSLQPIPNNQAVSGNHAIPGLQSVSGLQGLVSIPGLSTIPAFSTIPALSTIPGVQSVGIIGPQVESLQTMTTLQGNVNPQDFGGVAGVSGVLSVLPTLPGESSTKSACQESTTQNSKGNRDQGVGSTIEVEREVANIQQLPECQEVNNDSLGTVSSSPIDLQPVIFASCSPEKFKVRSRRKQASPRCISEQQILSFPEEPNESNTYGMMKEDSAKSVPSSLANISQTEPVQLRPPFQAKIEHSRQGGKLSKKVEELKRKSELDIDCSIVDPVDEESPSPQTWRRFVVRQKQLSDRLRVVEGQLQILQDIHFKEQSNGYQEVAIKSSVSIATQTDQHNQWEEHHFQWRENIGQMLQNAEELSGQSVGTRTHGQIQQGVVTSSGDSAGREIFSDVVGNEEKTRMNISPIDTFYTREEVLEPSLLATDVKPRIVNRPSNIWLASHKRGKKVVKAPVKFPMPLLTDMSNGDPKMSIDNEVWNGQMPLHKRLKETQPLPEQQKRQYVYQIPLTDIDDASGNGHHDDNSEKSMVESKNTSKDNLNDQSNHVQPWEIQGLTKIERNRIRAREGMRKHRKKLRQAKVAFETRMFEATTLPSIVNPATLHCEKSKSKIQSTCSLQFAATHYQTSSSIIHSGTTEALHTDPLAEAQDTSIKPVEVLNQVDVNDGNMVDVKPVINKPFPTTEVDDAKKSLSPSTNSTLHEVQLDLVPSKLEKNRIDFTKEPYKSMSLQERNRLRAREGMRRYRERMKQARLHVVPEQLSKVSHAEPCVDNETHKQDVTEAQAQCPSASESKQVAAADQLVELARRHAKNVPSIPSYSERLQHNKVEALKRRRAVSLVRSSAGQSRSKTSDTHILKASETDPLLSDTDIVKLNHIMPIKSEHLDISDQDQNKGSSKQLRYWSTSRKKEFTRTKALENYLKLPADIPVYNEQPKSEERKKQKSEKKRKAHPDMGQRKRFMRHRTPCQTESAIEEEEECKGGEDLSEEPTVVKQEPHCHDLHSMEATPDT